VGLVTSTDKPKVPTTCKAIHALVALEPDGSALFRRVEMDRFVKAIKKKDEV
jgi:hypothetical protein